MLRGSCLTGTRRLCYILFDSALWAPDGADGAVHALPITRSPKENKPAEAPC